MKTPRSNIRRVGRRRSRISGSCRSRGRKTYRVVSTRLGAAQAAPSVVQGATVVVAGLDLAIHPLQSKRTWLDDARAKPSLTRNTHGSARSGGVRGRQTTRSDAGHAGRAEARRGDARDQGDGASATPTNSPARVPIRKACFPRSWAMKAPVSWSRSG